MYGCFAHWIIAAIPDEDGSPVRLTVGRNRGDKSLYRLKQEGVVPSWHISDPEAETLLDGHDLTNPDVLKGLLTCPLLNREIPQNALIVTPLQVRKDERSKRRMWGKLYDCQKTILAAARQLGNENEARTLHHFQEMLRAAGLTGDPL